MTPAEAQALLAIAASVDNRKPDPDVAKAWSVMLDGCRFEDCRDAVVAHYRRSSEWLTPAQIIAEVRRIRAKRVADHGPIELTADPDDTLAYRRELRESQRAIGDGNPPPVTHIAAVPMPKTLAAGMAGFGVMPPTDHTTDQTDRPQGDAS